MNLIEYIIKHKKHLKDCIEGSDYCDICHDALYYVWQLAKEMDTPSEWCPLPFAPCKHLRRSKQHRGCLDCGSNGYELDPPNDWDEEKVVYE